MMTEETCHVEAHVHRRRRRQTPDGSGWKRSHRGQRTGEARHVERHADREDGRQKRRVTEAEDRADRGGASRGGPHSGRDALWRRARLPQSVAPGDRVRIASAADDAPPQALTCRRQCVGRRCHHAFYDPALPSLPGPLACSGTRC